MKKYYNKFNGIKKTGDLCKYQHCKKELILTDKILSNGENICSQCLESRNKFWKNNGVTQ